MLTLDLLDRFQFGPHTLEVVTINGRTLEDPDRMITARCIESCCSNGNAVRLTMSARELDDLVRAYNDQFSAAKMQARITRIIARAEERRALEEDESRSSLEIENVALTK